MTGAAGFFARLFGRDQGAGLERGLRELAMRDGREAVEDCAALLAGRAFGKGGLGALRGFCRSLFEARRYSWLTALERAVRERAGVPEDAGAIIGFYALRAEYARQCYLSVDALHERTVAPHRRRGAYEDWQERLIDEALANALVKQARTGEARAILEARLRAEPDQASLMVFQARLVAADDPAAALAGLRRADAAARAEGETLPAAALLAADLAAALGRIDDAENILRAQGEENPPPDFHLARANLARASGRHDEQRRHIGEWFRHYGLWSPAADGEGCFRIGAIGPSSLERREDGPLVSVVMTAYNAAATVDYAAASVLDQTHANLELFIVDDASTDATRARLAALAEKDRRVRLLFNDENSGPYVSKNRAIREAAGDFLTFHDADDWRHPEHIARHLATLGEAPRLAASRSRWSRIDAKGAFALAPWGAYAHACPSATMIRRAVFDEIGFFDSVRFGADTEFWARIETRYGAAGRAELEAPLTLGLASDHSLTAAGAGAIGEDGANAPRLAYWEAQARWRDEMWLAGKPLFVAFPLADRPFPAPPALTGDAGMDRPDDG